MICIQVIQMYTNVGKIEGFVYEKGNISFYIDGIYMYFC